MERLGNDDTLSIVDLCNEHAPETITKMAEYRCSQVLLELLGLITTLHLKNVPVTGGQSRNMLNMWRPNGD